MPLTFGDTHPSAMHFAAADADAADADAMSPVDTADLLFYGRNFRLLENDARAVEADLAEFKAEKRRVAISDLEAELAEVRADNRRLRAELAELKADNRLQSELAELKADNRRLEAQVRSANDAWETKHIFGFALKEPVDTN